MKNVSTFLRILLLVVVLLTNACNSFQQKMKPEGKTETDIIGQLTGGFFYTVSNNTTNKSEVQYIQLRKDSIASFNDAVKNIANDAFNITNGLNNYENTLLEYMDKINEDPEGVVFQITEEMLVNKISIHSYQEQIKKYLSAETNDDLSKALMDRFLFETVCDLVLLQKKQLSWLIDYSEVVFAMLNKTDPSKAQEFITTCTSLYSTVLKDNYINLLNKYYFATEVYTHILSADFYMGEYYLQEIQRKLDHMNSKAKEKNEVLIASYKDILSTNRKLPIIIEVPSVNLSDQLPPRRNLALPFGIVSYAAEEGLDEYYTNAIAILLLQELQLKILDREWYESITEILLTDFLLDSNTSKGIKIVYERQTSYENDRNLRRRMIQEINIDSTTEEEKKEEVNRIKLQTTSMESRSNASIDRQAIINNLRNGQDALIAIGLLGTDAQYSMIITMINTLLTDNKNLDADKIKNISNLINNDLIDILGDKKEDFINKITREQAEELYSIFTEWKNDTDHFREFDFDKNDLIRLVQLMGLEISEVPNQTPETIPEITQPLLKGFWELVDTEEIIPKTYATADDSQRREYTFEYTEGFISCSFEKVVYDGIKKTYLSESIMTSGGWSLLNDDGAFLPDERVKLKLTTNINHFQRLTPASKGGSGTNYTGVAVWAYIGNSRTPFGNATSGVLETSDGESVCRATISDGEITVSTNTIEVVGTFGPGKDKEQRILFVVVSNQGRIGGIKYTFEYLE
jgi:hypothetical protein